MKRLHTVFLFAAILCIFNSSVILAQSNSKYPVWTNYRPDNTGLGGNVVNGVAVDSSGNQWYVTSAGVAEYNGSVWKAYSAKDLPTRSVGNVIVAGPLGNIWVSSSGLLKFDGSNWTVLNTTNSKLPSDQINDIKVQADTLWIGTNGGLVKMFSDSITVNTIKPGNSTGTFTEIDHIAFDGNGRMWVVSKQAVLYGTNTAGWTDLYDGTNYYPLDFANYIDAITYSGKDSMYISQGALYSYNYNQSAGHRWHKIVLNTGNPDEVVGGVQSMFYHNGTIWIANGTGKWGLASFDGSNWTFDEDTTQYISSISSNFCMLGDSLFFGGSYQTKSFKNPLPGLIHYNYTNNGAKYYSYQTTGMGSNNVYSLAFDKNNHLWAGLWGGQPLYPFLTMYDGQNWHTFDTTSVHLNDAITTDMTFDQNGNLWFGLTKGGIVKYDGQSFREFDTSNSNLPSNYVQAIAVDQNDNVWVGTKPDYYHQKHGGLAVFNGQSWAVYDTSNSGLTSNNVDAIVVDNNNHIWIGSKDRAFGTNDGGLVEYDGTNWTVQISKNNNHSFPDRQIFSLAVDKNNKIWAGSGFENIYSYDGSNWSQTQVPVLPNSTYSEIDYVNKLYVDSNNILWGNAYSKAKLIAYDGSQWVQYYNTNSPLTAELNNGLVEGPNGYIWISSINGIYKIKDDPTIFTAIQKDIPGSRLPQKVKLEQNYPNPFNPSTNISFELPRAMRVSLVIYNTLGRVVTQVSTGRLSAGRHEIVWQASHFASGVYFYRLRTPNRIITKKMILLK
jgi:ligand-binding sensor domain-containing protein